MWKQGAIDMATREKRIVGDWGRLKIGAVRFELTISRTRSERSTS